MQHQMFPIGELLKEGFALTTCGYHLTFSNGNEGLGLSKSSILWTPQCASQSNELALS